MKTAVASRCPDADGRDDPVPGEVVDTPPTAPKPARLSSGPIKPSPPTGEGPIIAGHVGLQPPRDAGADAGGAMSDGGRKAADGGRKADGGGLTHDAGEAKDDRVALLDGGDAG